MTTKIDSTTARVVRSPTDSALPVTCIPWKQPIMAMMMPNTGALMRPMTMSDSGVTSCRRWTKVTGGMSSDSQQNSPPPMHRHDGAEEAEQQQHQRHGEDARHHQHLDRRHADGRQRIDFLVELHRADLRRKGRGRAPGDHDRGEQYAEFAQHRTADEVDDEDFGAKGAQLHRALLRDDDADEEEQQPDDAERVDADVFALVDDGVPAQRPAAGQGLHQHHHRLAEKGEEAADVGGHRDDGAADAGRAGR